MEVGTKQLPGTLSPTTGSCRPCSFNCAINRCLEGVFKVDTILQRNHFIFLQIIMQYIAKHINHDTVDASGHSFLVAYTVFELLVICQEGLSGWEIAL